MFENYSRLLRGVKKTEKELLEFSGCDLEHGSPAKALVSTAYRYGLEGRIQDNFTLKDLDTEVNRELRPVIVNWFSEDDGHYSVVVGIDEENVYLADPDVGYLRALRIDIFQRVWFDFQGDYIRTPEDLILRWMIVLYPAQEESRVSEREKFRLRGGKGRRSSR